MLDWQNAVFKEHFLYAQITPSTSDLVAFPLGHHHWIYPKLIHSHIQSRLPVLDQEI